MVTVWMFVAVACSDLGAASPPRTSTSRRKLLGFSSWNCDVAFCTECEFNNSNQCMTCDRNMFLNPKDGTCSLCFALGCETCDPMNSARCTQCSLGFSLQSDGTCNSITPAVIGVTIGLSVGIPALCCLVGGLGFWFYMAKGSPKRRPMTGATPYGAAPPYTNTQPQGVPRANTQAQGVPYTNALPQGAPYSNAQPQGAPYANTDLQGAPYTNTQPLSAAPYAPYTNTQPQTPVPHVNTKM